ncbi:MAG: restriction endonuclease [Methylohalobius sp.]|nr:restriction endonuclease [Methylohalobius sp.]
MAIPDYQSLMLPLLQFLEDGQERPMGQAIEALAEKLGLTEEEREALLPSGQQRIFDNRVSWARTYMKKAGLIASPRRGFIGITELGKQVLAQSPLRIDVSFLERFESFRQFKSGRRETSLSGVEETPEESFEAAYDRFRQVLAEELLEKLKVMSPAGFERLVVDLLVKMGYGGTRQEAGLAIGKSGDGGIDGIINEDRLGLDVVYIQAKRWEGSVGRPEVQKFAGALQGHKARKGVFITTSNFTKEALEYVRLIDAKIVPIDGQRLVQLMIDYNVGVAPVAAYEIKKIDYDYFAEE